MKQEERRRLIGIHMVSSIQLIMVIIENLLLSRLLSLMPMSLEIARPIWPTQKYVVKELK
jgi:hypothetical protein